MTNDYLMRYIEETSRALAKWVLGRKDFGEYEMVLIEDGFSQDNFLRYRLNKHLIAGEINEAENLLFETLEEDPSPHYLPPALDFYESLAAMSDAKLAASGFSRSEIAEGLAALRQLFSDNEDIPQEEPG